MFFFLRAIKHGEKITHILILNLVFSILANLLLLAAPLFVGYSVDQMIGLGEVNFNRVILHLIIVASLYGVGTILSYIAILMANLYAIRLCQIVKVKAFTYITTSPLEYFEKSASGDMLVRLTLDMTQLQDAITFFFTHFMTGVTTVIGTLIFMLVLSWQLGLVVLLMSIPIIFYTRRVSKKGEIQFASIQHKTALATNYAQEMFDQQEVIVSFNYHAVAKKQFADMQERIYQESKKGYLAASMNNPTFRFFQNLTFGALGLVFLLLTIYGGAPLVGTFMTITMYAGLFAKPLNELASVTQQFLLGSASYQRLENNLFEYEYSRYDKGYDTANLLISYQNVYCSAGSDDEILRGVNIDIPYGTKVGIAGPSGAGKSTFLALLLRFYNASKGAIKIGDMNINSIKIEDYSRLISVVLQDPWLFHGTFKDNIAYGKETATLAEVIAVSQVVGCYEFIVNFKDGFDTIVDNTVHLSLGQRQLISLARAILSNPAIYVFDEPTSNLDATIEQSVLKVMAEVTKGKTMFLVAHRLETLKNCDLILIFENGTITQQGTHEELINQPGCYQDLWKLQEK